MTVLGIPIITSPDLNNNIACTDLRFLPGQVGFISFGMFFQCIFASLQVIHIPMLCKKSLNLCKQWFLRERLLVARLERLNSFIFCRRKPKSVRTWSLCYEKLKLVFTLTSLTYLPLMEFRRCHFATQLLVALNLMLCFKQTNLMK